MNDERAARNGRLRWHCRRALLELDIVFQRFWQHQEENGGDLDDETAATLERLLALEDHDLWDLVSGRTATDDSQLMGLVERLRQT